MARIQILRLLLFWQFMCGFSFGIIGVLGIPWVLAGTGIAGVTIVCAVTIGDLMTDTRAGDMKKQI